MLSKNVKQSLIATSTMEENFIACYEVSNQGIWLRNFINKLRIVDGIERLLSINCDNKNAKLYSKNNITSSKLKHSDIRFLVVKERVQSLQVSIDHISTNFFYYGRIYHLKCCMSMWLILVSFILVICLSSRSLLVDIHLLLTCFFFLSNLSIILVLFIENSKKDLYSFNCSCA